MKTPELLLPVANMEMCQAAVHNGANAIYVGMPGFNARGRALELSFQDLKEIIDFCHLYLVKVHVAFNILIFQNELPKAKTALKELLILNPDAIIVQDLGLVRLIREMCPDQVIHASTQMTITNEQAIEFTRDLKIERYVLGRENSLSDIKAIKQATDKELEVFVHGALCVAYSGQCFTSESIGGRSANRGKCAQSCRFEYDLIVDGEKKDLVDRNYLVSPKDLCGLKEIPQLKELGIDSLKIEGRLKGPNYVATAASSYKKALENESISSDEMALTYSRGFYSGWLNGVDHQDLVDGTFGNNRGLKIGKVLKTKKRELTLTSHRPLLKGDGLLFVDSNPNRPNQAGSRIYSVNSLGNQTYAITMGPEIDLSSIQKNSLAFLTSSPKFDKEIQRSYTDKHLHKKNPLSIFIKAYVGEKIILKGNYNNFSATVESDIILEKAKGPIHEDKIIKEISSLGSTVFKVEEIELDLSPTPPFVPNKILKELRRNLIIQLTLKLTAFPSKEILNYDLPTPVKSKKKTTQGKLRILLRDMDQVKSLEKFISSNDQVINYLDSVILDFEFGKDYRPSLDILKSNNITAAIATNRILKPNEYHHLKTILRLEPDYILARNLGSFQFLKAMNPSLKICGDFSLNVSNSLTSDYLFNKGFETLTTSYDLNERQMLEMVEHSNNKDFEVTIHQYMPSFHMEHCVYAAFLSKGSSFKDCGKPCEKHKVELHDQFGNKHFIKADQECRNTMFNATSISAPKILQKCLDQGIEFFRIEILNENESEMFKKLDVFFKLLQNKISPEQLEKELGDKNQNIGSLGPLFISN